jgi:hypothetical protein
MNATIPMVGRAVLSAPPAMPHGALRTARPTFTRAYKSGGQCYEHR